MRTSGLGGVAGRALPALNDQTIQSAHVREAYAALRLGFSEALIVSIPVRHAVGE